MNSLASAPRVAPLVARSRKKKKPTRLTQRLIADLRPQPGTQYVAWDTELKGFGVRVSPAGAKAFLLKYRTKAGRGRWATLGRVDALSLEDARDKARRMVGQVADGKDPLREIDTSKGAVTVRHAATRFLEYVAATKKPRTHAAYKQIIDSAIVPRLGTLPIRELGTDDAAGLHYRLRATPIHANRVLAVLSSLLSWCMPRKLFPQGPNPCQGIERYKERKRKRYLSRDEYARLGKALAAVKRTEAIGPIVRTAIEVLLLTGARPIEVASLQWDFVDLKGAALRLPDSKTGEKTIHLSPAAVRLLKRWPRWAGSDFVFPGTRRGVIGAHLHSSTLSHAWDVLRTMAKLSDVRLYDACRHSYASEAISRHQLTLAAIGEQLGHSQPATTARYAHLHDEIARANARKIGGGIATALRSRTKA